MPTIYCPKCGTRIYGKTKGVLKTKFDNHLKRRHAKTRPPQPGKRGTAVKVIDGILTLFSGA